MKINELLKKRVLLFIGSMLFISGITILTTFAINKSDYVNEQMLVDNKNLQVVYNSSGENVENSLKTMSFQQGIENIDLKEIKILNKTEFSTRFSLCVQKINMSNEMLDLEKVYYSVNGISGVVGHNKNNCIYESSIEGNKSVELDFKLWIGSDLLEESDEGKTLEYRLIIK